MTLHLAGAPAIAASSWAAWCRAVACEESTQTLLTTPCRLYVGAGVFELIAHLMRGGDPLQ